MQRHRNRSPFDPQAFLSFVDGGRTVSEYNTDQVICRQGDPADSVFYIQAGKVKMTVVSEHGKEAVVGVLCSGDFFGESCLGAQPLRTATATAMTHCVIARIAKTDLVGLLQREPAFAQLLISHLLARNSRIEADLVDQLFNSTEKRLARTLLLLADFGEDDRPAPVEAKVTHETLAEIVGTTRAHVSFFMSKFRRLGLIDYNGHLEVNRALLNHVLQR